MKRFLIYSSIIVIAIGIISCEDSFDLYSDFYEQYILTCIIRSDTTYQTAILTHSYPNYTGNPYDNTTNPELRGADIRIRQGDKIIFMRDTTILNIDKVRYSDSLHYYYTSNFIPGGEDSLEIIATLQDGRQFYGSTQIAREIEFDSTTNSLLPDTISNQATFKWNSEVTDQWYLPRVLVFYKIGDTLFSEKIPIGFENGKLFYPAISISNRLSVANIYLDTVFNSIASKVEDRSSVTILGGVFELIIFDDVLSKYYSSTNGFLDDFTIQFEENDYTNISGGFGVFGSYLKQARGFFISSEYIKSFGFVSIN